MKNSKSKKLLAAALSATLLLGAAGCEGGGSSSGATGGTSGANATSLLADAKKPESITFMVNGTFLLPEDGQKSVVDKYKELTGINLIINQPTHNEYQSKVNLAFATGDIPDALILAASDYLNFAANGALADITDLYESSDLKKRITAPGVIDQIKINGRLYGLPIQRGNGTITYVRGDWMEKLGIKNPTNYDEFYAMLKKFKEADPAGGGKTIPITAAGLVNTEYPLDIYLREFYQDATPDFVKVDGKWVDGMSQPNMVAALERMAKAFKDGLIDVDITTNKTSTCRDKFYAGQVGTFNYWSGTWNKTLRDNLLQKFPDADVVPIPAIKETKYVERPAVPISVTTKAKDPVAVYKYLLEYMLDSGEGQMLFSWGVEGVHYEMKDGKFKRLPSLQNPKNPAVKAFAEAVFKITDFKDPETYENAVTNSIKMFDKDAVQYGLLPATEVMSSYLPELNTARTTYVSKIVTGDFKVEEGLAKYKTETKGMVDAILADINK